MTQKEFEERMIVAAESIAASLAKLADAFNTPSCGHGTVGFCNYCLMQTLANSR